MSSSYRYSARSTADSMAPGERLREEDSAELYTQPERHGTGNSNPAEWHHWRVNEKQLQEASSSLDDTSDKENDYETAGVSARMRHRKNSKSGFPTKTLQESDANFSAENQKRWSRPPVPDNNPAFRQTLLIIISFIVIFALLLGCGLLYYVAQHGYIVKVSRPDLMPAFNRKLTDLRAQFPAQPEHNWAIVRGAFAEVLNSSQYKYGPAVLVILASKKDQHLASCFAGKLATSLARTFDPTEWPIQLNGAKLSRLHNSMVAKHAIDSAVRERDKFVMQFESLEQIDSYTASIFHSFCDYDNSPFRHRAVFIFTVHTSEETEGRRRREYDAMADNVLNEVWDELDVNKRSALIARLTGSTILLRKESRRVC